MRGPLHTLLLIVVMAALVACDDSEPPLMEPTAGPLTYRLVSPNGPEGAMAFTVPANQVNDVRRDDPFHGDVLVVHEADGVLHVAMISRLPNELLIELVVPDIDDPPQPEVVAVAGPDNARRALAGYELEVAR